MRGNPAGHNAPAVTAALAHRPLPDPRLLRRSLLLAALLHVWLVLVFGNASGTAAPGQGVWGSLTVKLLGRNGNTPAAAPAAEPGAAQAGRWNPREVAPEMARTDDTSAASPSTATLDLPEGFQPIERENLMAPSSRATPAPAAELPTAVGRLEPRPEAAVTALPTATSLPTPARTADLPALELPSAINRLDAAPAPARAATLPRPAAIHATPAQPLPDGTALPAPVQRLEAPTTDGAAATPLSRPGELRAPATTSPLPSDESLPAPVRRLEAGAADLAPLASAAPGARTLPAAPALPELSQALPGEVGAPAAGDAAEVLAAPKASAGSPGAGPRLGANPASPPLPSATASAPRAPLDLSLPRGAIAARRGPGLIDLLPQPPERKSKLEQSIEDAANKDCRQAYANTGLLAALPLALDAARGKGCKW